MADPVFHDGMQDYNDKLNAMKAQLDTSPYAAEPTIAPGTTTQYWRGDKTWRDLAGDVRAAVLTGLSLAGGAAVVATDTILAAIGKLQVQVTGKQASLGFNPVQNGTGVGQAANPLKLGYVAATARIAATVDVTDFGNFAMEGSANSYSQLQTFNSRALSTNGAFIPGNTSWVNAAYTARGSFGGGYAAIDTNGNLGGAWWVQGATIFFGYGAQAGGLQQAVCIGTAALFPAADNAFNCGTASARWGQYYGASSAINTSDARLKTDVRPMAEAELAAAKQLGQEIGFYQFLSAVAAKGDALARLHAGMTVQHAIAIMESHGLDAMAYGFICYDEWAETSYEHPEQRDPDVDHPAVWQSAVEHLAVLDEDGETVLREAYTEPAVLLKAAHTETGALIAAAWTEVKPAGNIYSFRYDELNQFILAGMHAHQVAIEARLVALESAA